jgi:ABC-2 type transport system ATP-binding protein
MIEVTQLGKRFGDLEAVRGIDFRVRPGEVLGFLGPNGAGKSTTMKMIAGFIAPSSGRVTVCGFDVQEDTLSAQRLIGYLPEGAPSYDDMTVVEFLGFIAEVRGFGAAEREQRVARVMEQMGLGAVCHQRIETLSKGFKRRVGLAQAILHDPQVLILDEPTDGLDPNQKHQVRELIRGLSSDKIVIISTHILEEVHAVCNRAIIIAAGRIVADGTPVELEALSRYHRAVHIHFAADRGPADTVAAREALSALPGVAEVESHAGGRRLVVVAAPGASPLPAVARLVHDRGWEVDELHVERGRLDEVFRDFTREVA